VYFQGPQQDFVTRQQTFELAKQRRQELRAHHADSKCTFKPEISDTSRQIVSGNIEYVGETLDERINRLAVRDVERREKVKAELEELHYKECTFKPALNPTSQMIASKFDDVASMDSADPNAAIHERLYRLPLNRSKCSDDSRADECTFAPAMSSHNAKRFAHVKSRYSAQNGSHLMDNIQEELQKKEEHLSEKRREREEEYYAACTFNPETTKSYQEPDSVVVVSGLGRYFELRDLARRKEEDQAKREAKVFRPNSKMRCDGITIPEPFALSRGGKDTQRPDDYMHAGDECTFAPTTNESENRKLLRHIMSSDGVNPDLPEFSYDAYGPEWRTPVSSSRWLDDSTMPGASTLGDRTNVGRESAADVWGQHPSDMQETDRYSDRQVNERMAALLARMQEPGRQPAAQLLSCES